MTEYLLKSDVMASYNTSRRHAIGIKPLLDNLITYTFPDPSDAPCDAISRKDLLEWIKYHVTPSEYKLFAELISYMPPIQAAPSVSSRDDYTQGFKRGARWAPPPDEQLTDDLGEIIEYWRKVDCVSSKPEPDKLDEMIDNKLVFQLAHDGKQNWLLTEKGVDTLLGWLRPILKQLAARVVALESRGE